ncbi:NAD-dependent epimerase/dehydratase family protein [Sporosarcina sp. ACRSM]|uniref:NAD-dependent epimerase/dehydratase family protein n=1 Tax=Sporosarcina sp. ACRSM TaxID=2918216 RepID=UPI001EF66374|nr:NAD-dependent epimerase/dehydratase family protein [Sporosarcina sp. ACRSM]MCG7334339.1 NAD-dependent epimerase/dehydratase family protein [Sporosarcina sp. ACRSM]
MNRSMTFSNISNDEILLEDLKSIANSNIPLSELQNKTVFVTGATGLLGSQLVKSLISFNKLCKTNIKVIALARDVNKAERVFRHLLKDSRLNMVYQDITQPLNLEGPVDYIVHGASVTSSKIFISNPVETIQVALRGTENILNLAKDKCVKGLVYLSSLEVYGAMDFPNNLISETDFGVIDPLKVRSSYSESKRMVECLCSAYFYQFGIPIKVARLTQTFGAGVKYDDDRVFAQFARSVIEKKDIVLHTPGDTVRSYCYTADAIRALIFILIKGENGQAYNVANKDTAISIKEMAELLTNTYSDTGIKVVFDLGEDSAKLGYNPVVKINLDTAKLESLGWRSKIDLLEMYERMIRSMRFQSGANSAE